MRILLPMLVFSIAACAPTARELQQQADAEAGTRASLDRELAGLTPSRPQDCASRTELREVKTYGDTLVYRTNGNDRIVTRTSGSCERVGDTAYLVTSVPSTQLCRGDHATVIDRTVRQPVGSCIYGDFTRYSRSR